MKKWTFRPIDRSTPDLFPASVDDYLPEHHLARFVVEIVEELDLDPLISAYSGKGSKAWHPSLMLSLLFYGYATGIFSSRKLEKATHDSIAFRYICANQHPDHDSINTFRRRFRQEISALFTQILMIAKEARWLTMGTISLDGTKMKANASKHKALSYGHACKLEKQLKAEVEELLSMAEQVDAREPPEALSIPEELKRREDRLAVIAKAKAEIERRAEERHQQALAEYHEKVSRREAASASGKKPKGKAPQAPVPGPRDKDQVNLTDPDSRIMPTSGGGFEQAYNVQAAVDVESGLIVEKHLTQATNDKQQIGPALEELATREAALGKVDALLADTGYFSESNVSAVVDYGATPYIAQKRDAHNQPLMERFKPDDPMPEGEDVTALEVMRWRLKTQEGRAIYALRKSTIEPTFGIQKDIMGYRRFLVRGLAAVTAEWDLVCMAFNLKKMFTLLMADIENSGFLMPFLAGCQTFLTRFCCGWKKTVMVRTLPYSGVNALTYPQAAWVIGISLGGVLN